MTPPMAKTVSALLVFMPNASEIPDHASPKNAIVKNISRIPITPVVTKAPKAYAKPRIMAVWTTTLKASLVKRPRRMAGRLIGVTSILCKSFLTARHFQKRFALEFLQLQTLSSPLLAVISQENYQVLSTTE
jgi:hypothetical protein